MISFTAVDYFLGYLARNKEAYEGGNDDNGENSDDLVPDGGKTGQKAGSYGNEGYSHDAEKKVRRVRYLIQLYDLHTKKDEKKNHAPYACRNGKRYHRIKHLSDKGKGGDYAKLHYVFHKIALL